VIRLWDVRAGRPVARDETNFQQIGHSLITVFFAIAGGVAARLTYSERRKETRNLATSTTNEGE
jgi:hypothetical protein